MTPLSFVLLVVVFALAGLAWWLWVKLDHARALLEASRATLSRVCWEQANGPPAPLHETVRRLRADVIAAFDRATNQPSYQESVYAHDAQYGGNATGTTAKDRLRVVE